MTWLAAKAKCFVGLELAEKHLRKFIRALICLADSTPAWKGDLIASGIHPAQRYSKSPFREHGRAVHFERPNLNNETEAPRSPAVEYVRLCS